MVAGEKHTACEEAFEQAGFFLQTGSSSYISTKTAGQHLLFKASTVPIFVV